MYVNWIRRSHFRLATWHPFSVHVLPPDVNSFQRKFHFSRFFSFLLSVSFSSRDSSRENHERPSFPEGFGEGIYSVCSRSSVRGRSRQFAINLPRMRIETSSLRFLRHLSRYLSRLFRESSCCSSSALRGAFNEDDESHLSPS
jgi:hypothetical protein